MTVAAPEKANLRDEEIACGCGGFSDLQIKTSMTERIGIPQSVPALGKIVKMGSACNQCASVCVVKRINTTV